MMKQMEDDIESQYMKRIAKPMEWVRWNRIIINFLDDNISSKKIQKGKSIEKIQNIHEQSVNYKEVLIKTALNLLSIHV